VAVASRVTEHVDILVHAPLMACIFDQGFAAHRTMFTNLRARFTAAAR